MRPTAAIRERMAARAFTSALVAFVVSGEAGAVSAQSAAPSASGSDAPAAGALPPERVLGVGGFFFRATDPESLSEWYERHLGVTRTPRDYSQEPWRQESGPTVFAPFVRDTRFFGPGEHQWMINFRVRDLDAMVAQLRRAGIDVAVDPQLYPNGRFARLNDPEGNPIQLWEMRLPEQPL